MYICIGTYTTLYIDEDKIKPGLLDNTTNLSTDL